MADAIAKANAGVNASGQGEHAGRSDCKSFRDQW